jgi:hypothetical protein
LYILAASGVLKPWMDTDSQLVVVAEASALLERLGVKQ